MACGNAGWLLAGVEFSDECYYGNATQNNAQPITSDCTGLPQTTIHLTPNVSIMRCKGNDHEFCGGPNIVSINTLPGPPLLPMIPFDSDLDGICDGRDCVGNFKLTKHRSFPFKIRTEVASNETYTNLYY